ncbi:MULTISPECIES: aspartate/glutamate racemase family protein [Pseudomonas]|uniref:maleate cis-trans isomerase family protein n=1 Tax=Pseudomonas TaxID=286 RepID=UPI001562D98A|nr:aspartate/glutamate racemase family protein [Pseudomonas sp. MS19]NRH27152.1 Asp/Glu racemase [Pseudomonas sp. MS19]
MIETFAEFQALQQHFEHQSNQDDGRVRVGLVQLASDFTLENEWRQLLGERVELYSTRTPCSPTVTPGGLRAMSQGLSHSTSLLVPGLPLDVIAFGCTSGSMLIGEQEVGALINSVRPGVPVTNPWSAVKAALRALGARKVAVLTPYISEVNYPIFQGLRQAGLTISAFGTFGVLEDAQIPRIPAPAIERAAEQLLRNNPADALFLSCTNLHTLEILERLERRLGIPVISSNQALFWHVLQLSNCVHRPNGFGALLTDNPSATLAS